MTSVETVLDLLGGERRRYALYELAEREQPIRVEELAKEVARMDADGSGVPDEVVERHEIRLRHDHLPKAAEAEFVEYDSGDGVVRLTDEPPEFEALLTVAEVMERPL